MVAAALIEALEALDLQYPKVEGAALKEIQQVRNALKFEGGRTKVTREPSKRSWDGHGYVVCCNLDFKSPAIAFGAELASQRALNLTSVMAKH